jgi:hypothetical protein
MHARRNCLLQRDEWGSQEEEKMAFDLLIKNGRVVDGRASSRIWRMW